MAFYTDKKELDNLGKDMPKVGKKKFPYTPKGMKRAKKVARKSGKKVKYGRK
tara:strand:+ start:239 stop:394 length:156 start_codon:yes stop_codon:yes gene_type:complete